MTPREIHEAEVAKAAARPAPQSELLSTVRLQLNPTVRGSTLPAKRVLLRSAAGRRRLVLTPAQNAILRDFFTEPTTVPAALAKLLGDRDQPPWTEYGCPPLSEYYELILQAHAAGVLVPAGTDAERTLAVHWLLRVPVSLARALGTNAILASAVALVIAPLSFSTQPMDLLVGWGFALVLLSAGQLLAASVLVSAGGEARCFRLHWLTLFPHLQIDAEEAVMGGRNCEFAVAELRATPVAIAAAVLAWQSSASLGPVLAGFFYVLAPWRGSAAWQWLSAFRAPRYSVRAGAIFEPRREDLWLRWSAWVADIRLGAEILSGLWLLAWAALAAVTAAELRPSLAEKTLALLGPGWRVHTALKCGLTAIAVVVAVGVVVLVLARIQHWRSQREAARPLRGEGALRMEAALDGDLPAMLRQVPLFEATPKVDLMEIAAAMKTVGFKKGENVFVEDAPGDTFSVVLEGEFEVLKRRAAPARGADVIGRFGPGDSFGEIALLEGTARTATVRAVQPGRLLQLAKWDFMKLVAAQVGTARVHDLLQHAVFLGRLVFMAGWPFEDLVRFAKCCTTTRYAAGAQLLRKGDTNLWFHLIFDGAFEAREGGKVLRRLQPGDYFGEISLLENGLATADVFALEESRCLLMHRNDFLAFFAHDYRIGLRVEALAVARLGARLFVSR